ncbi:unnamed protein product [Owenia fusiformis]|uniref:Uncharacterized protein n=1 Tax=Owenia fusiformis TaxID=6347 RepID=A0A8J1UDA3_OWEFU|nr:unnamed protein product [Owenia fusiformis]
MNEMARKSESGFQVLARLGARPDISRLDTILFPDGLSQRQVIELFGGEGTGKTEMLMYLIVRCILPKTWNGLHIGGLGIGVVFLDTDYHFSILRLATILETHLTKAVQQNNAMKCENNTLKNDTIKFNTNQENENLHDANGDKITGITNQTGLTEEQIETFVKSCFQRLHVIRCNTSTQLVVTVHSLESLLGNHPDIGVLMLDSVSAFYWIDRNSGGDNVATQENNQRHLVRALDKLINEYNLVLFATKQMIFVKRQKQDQDNDSTPGGYHTPKGGSTNYDEIDHCEFMCKQWQTLVSDRWIFSRHEMKQVQKINSRSYIFRVLQTSRVKPKGHVTFGIDDSGIVDMQIVT